MAFDASKIRGYPGHRQTARVFGDWRTVPFGRKPGRPGAGLSADGDALDLDERVLRESRDLDGAAGRAGGREEFGVYAVHGREVVHVAQKDGRLDDVPESETGGGQHGRAVRERLPGLRLDALGELARGGVDRQLAGRDDKAARLDALGLRPDGGRGFVCLNDGLHGFTLLHIIKFYYVDNLLSIYFL